MFFADVVEAGLALQQIAFLVLDNKLGGAIGWVFWLIGRFPIEAETGELLHGMFIRDVICIAIFLISFLDCHEGTKIKGIEVMDNFSNFSIYIWINKIYY